MAPHPLRWPGARRRSPGGRTRATERGSSRAAAPRARTRPRAAGTLNALGSSLPAGQKRERERRPRELRARRASKVAETWGRNATAPEIALRGRCLLTPLAKFARRKKWLRYRAASARFGAPSSQEGTNASTFQGFQRAQRSTEALAKRSSRRCRGAPGAAFGEGPRAITSPPRLRLPRCAGTPLGLPLLCRWSLRRDLSKPPRLGDDPVEVALE